MFVGVGVKVFVGVGVKVLVGVGVKVLVGVGVGVLVSVGVALGVGVGSCTMAVEARARSWLPTVKNVPTGLSCWKPACMW